MTGRRSSRSGPVLKLCSSCLQKLRASSTCFHSPNSQNLGLLSFGNNTTLDRQPHLTYRAWNRILCAPSPTYIHSQLTTLVVWHHHQTG
ncbi:hypothetical protein AAG906_021199 [Vitis piasezkii]